MEELVKKFIYTGIGIVALTAEKLQESVDEMVGKGKVSKEEGKKIVEDFLNSVDVKKDDFEGKLKNVADNVSETIKLPKFMTKADYDALLKRVDAIEVKLNKTSGEEVKKVVKRTATRVKKTA